MANLKITLSLPEELAIAFVRAVPSHRRSRFVAGLIEAGLAERKAEREARLVVACEAANADPETRQIELEMDGLPDSMREEWQDTRELSETR